jgi:hypothetical protein
MRWWWTSRRHLRRDIRVGGLGAAVALCGLGAVLTAAAYPLDGDGYTGITRLIGYRLAADGEIRGPRQPAGARLPLAQVLPRLMDKGGLRLPEPDPQWSQQIRGLLGSEADRYGLAVLDMSDPSKPRYAEVNATQRYGPGSVGKLLVALGIFQALADIYPDDISQRERVLRDSMVTADDFIRTDSHKVPFWDSKARRLRWRPLVEGDRATLWTYLDWMLSASSNAAASTVMRELLLLVHYGRAYPVSDAERKRFFKETPRAELSALLARAMHEPVTRNGLDIERIRQGSFFTRRGKQRVPGVSSYADARELLRYVLLLEQGRLVDGFSSREIKRLLYMTQRRIRYASSPALADAAVYFKSGSFYRCRPEPGFTCGKYRGNVENWMNSVAIVEAPAQERRLFYMVTVMSNVLRKNSAVEHQTLGTRLQRLIESAHSKAPPASAP